MTQDAPDGRRFGPKAMSAAEVLNLLARTSPVRPLPQHSKVMQRTLRLHRGMSLNVPYKFMIVSQKILRNQSVVLECIMNEVDWAGYRDALLAEEFCDE